MLKRRRPLATMRTHVRDLLPLQIELDSSTYVFTWESGIGKWKPKNKGIESHERQIAALQSEIDRLTKENRIQMLANKDMKLKLYAIEKKFSRQKRNELEAKRLLEYEKAER